MLSSDSVSRLFSGLPRQLIQRSSAARSGRRVFQTGPTWLLVGVAVMMIQCVLIDRGSGLQHWIQLAVAVTLGLSIVAAERWTTGRKQQWTVAIGFAALVAFPLVGELIQRTFFASGNPFEILLVMTLRNLMIGLAARYDHSRSRQFAALASCFIVLFSFLWLLSPVTIALLVIYTATGMWWLMGCYWSRLSGNFVSHSQRVIPWKPVSAAAVFGVLVVLLFLPLAAGRVVTTAIRGLLPTSGGTQWQDDYAFGGVGDGNQVVGAQEDANSFGPVESGLFLESEMPSLYDCFNEFAEPPDKFKKKKKRRAIPLSPSQMKENHEKKGANKRQGREFSAVRQEVKDRQKADDLDSRALLQIVGRVPVHLGLYAYDMWDGRELKSSDRASAPDLYLDRGFAGRNWARYTGRIGDPILNHREWHELRIVNLKTARVPSPANTVAASIDQLHTEDMFETTADGMLAMDMAFIPQLSVIQIESLRRRSIQNPFPVRSERSSFAVSEEISSLARLWVDGVPAGWPQIEAICSRLRTEYRLDPAALVPEDADDAVVHFLQKAEGGPDYLFATSAALMLRTLGYETRVVSGFYARPENFDRQSRVTAVFAEDAHFWVEVLASSIEGEQAGLGNDQSFNQQWYPIEPTPGYEILYAPETLAARLWALVIFFFNSVIGNPILSLVTVAILSGVWIKRADLGDLAITTWWRGRCRFGDARDRVRSTLRLLERRAWVRGRPRLASTTLGRWRLDSSDAKLDRSGWVARSGRSLMNRLGAGPGSQRRKKPGPAPNRLTTDRPSSNWAEQFVDLANWALYGQGTPAKYSLDEINAVCSIAAATAFRNFESKNESHRWKLQR